MDECDTAVRNLGACVRGDWSRDLADALGQTKDTSRYIRIIVTRTQLVLRALNRILRKIVERARNPPINYLSTSLTFTPLRLIFTLEIHKTIRGL